MKELRFSNLPHQFLPKLFLVTQFLGSSMVERPAVNGKVAGSSPARGVDFEKAKKDVTSTKY